VHFDRWDLPSGVYLLKVVAGGKEQIKKVAVVR
jgi:hypothetical protein